MSGTVNPITPRIVYVIDDEGNISSDKITARAYAAVIVRIPIGSTKCWKVTVCKNGLPSADLFGISCFSVDASTASKKHMIQSGASGSLYTLTTGECLQGGVGTERTNGQINVGSGGPGDDDDDKGDDHRHGNHAAKRPNHDLRSAHGPMAESNLAMPRTDSPPPPRIVYFIMSDGSISPLDITAQRGDHVTFKMGYDSSSPWTVTVCKDKQSSEDLFGTSCFQVTDEREVTKEISTNACGTYILTTGTCSQALISGRITVDPGDD